MSMRRMKIFQIDPKTGAMAAGLALLAKDGAARLAWVGGVLIDIVLRAVMMGGIVSGLFLACLAYAPSANAWALQLAAAGLLSLLVGAGRSVWMGARRGLGAKAAWALAAGKADFLKIANRIDLEDRFVNPIESIGKPSAIAKSAGYLMLSPGLFGRGVLIGFPVSVSMRVWRAAKPLFGSPCGFRALAKNAGKAVSGGASRALGKIGEAARTRGSEALSRIEKERLEESAAKVAKGRGRKERAL